VPDVSAHPSGGVPWVELATTDTNAAVAFYGSVFGWNVVEHDMGPNGPYTIFTVRGAGRFAILTDPQGAIFAVFERQSAN